VTPRPFTIKVPDEALADLRARLERVRWPDEPPDAGWRYGTSLAYMKELVEHWRARYDWRAHEARLNRLRQFTVELGEIELHFVHEPGVGPAPLPLLLSHGWPGSIVEFERLIPMLTDPARFGGDPAIIGQSLTLDGRNRRVIGVMPLWHSSSRRSEFTASFPTPSAGEHMRSAYGWHWARKGAMYCGW